MDVWTCVHHDILPGLNRQVHNHFPASKAEPCLVGRRVIREFRNTVYTYRSCQLRTRVRTIEIKKEDSDDITMTMINKGNSRIILRKGQGSEIAQVTLQSPLCPVPFKTQTEWTQGLYCGPFHVRVPGACD